MAGGADDYWLHLVGEEDADAEAADADDTAADDAVDPETVVDSDVETLRDEFVDAFNGRDLDTIVSLVAADVDVADVPGADDGVQVLADEISAIWERSPGAILTRAYWDERSCAVAWLPDESGQWVRAGLWLFDAEGGLLSMVACPDDADALAAADAEDPAGEALEEWRDWGEWETGAETPPVIRG